jgi:hypothetical protein
VLLAVVVVSVKLILLTVNTAPPVIGGDVDLIELEPILTVPINKLLPEIFKLELDKFVDNILFDVI